MFTWICPQCGREVPPSESECPACAQARKQPAAPAYPPPQQAQYAPPQQPAYAPPQPPPQQQHHAPPPPPPPPQYGQQQPAPQYYPPQPQQQVYTLEQPKQGMPTWLVALLTIAVLGGGLFALYRFVGGGKSSATTSGQTKAAPQDPNAKPHPYQKYLEVAGVRLIEGTGKKPMVRFTVINHSDADLSGLELQITLTPTNGGDPISVIVAKVGTVPAQGVKDMESPLSTNLKVYELPDWQFVKSTVQITAPN
jgi:hypothetical protein